jgi:hypothetical protein
MQLLTDEIFEKKRIIFNIDNLAVVSVLSTKSSNNFRVMNLVRYIVYWSMMGSFQIKAFHISSVNNCIANEELELFVAQKERQIQILDDEVKNINKIMH